MINPGSIAFRKHLSQILPQRGGETKANYIARLARHFGFTTARMTVLYYDQRKDNARFTTTEYSKIFSTSFNPEAKNPYLSEIKSLLEEQKQEIKRLEHAYQRERETKRKLGEWLLSQ
jgi:hypothetical protein